MEGTCRFSDTPVPLPLLGISCHLRTVVENWGQTCPFTALVASSSLVCYVTRLERALIFLSDAMRMQVRFGWSLICATGSEG